MCADDHHTMMGVRAIPQDYLERGQRCSGWSPTTTFLKIISARPRCRSSSAGYRLSLGIAWPGDSSASEMLTLHTGESAASCGREYNSLIYAHILLAIVNDWADRFVLDRLMALAEAQASGVCRAPMAFIEVSRIASPSPSPRNARGRRRQSAGAANVFAQRGAAERFVSIVGAMGSGKSTLLSILAGLTTADSGSVAVDGPDGACVRADASFVSRTIRSCRGSRASRTCASPSRERIRLFRGRPGCPGRHALEQVGSATRSIAGPPVSCLAGCGSGWRLRAPSPPTPDGAVSRRTLRRARRAAPATPCSRDLIRLCSSAERPVTTVMITNSVEEAILLSDWIVPMEPGPPATLGAPIPVQLPRPRSAAQLAHEEVATQVRAHVVATLTAALGRRGPPIGRTRRRRCCRRDPGRSGGNPMNIPLELTGLTKVFDTPSGPFIAVKDVNAKVHAGEFVAVLGHSGCGKSTVLSMIAGLEHPTYGGVVIDGTQIVGPGAERAIVFQSPCLLPWLTARDNVLLAAAQRPGDHRPPATRQRGSLSRARGHCRRGGPAARAAVARDAAVRLAGASAVARAALPAPRRTVLAARLADPLRAAGHPCCASGRNRTRPWSWSLTTSMKRCTWPID
jgi:ABC-type nitrate/sulfonate/bicarbonate transport system ATPase subunit